MTNGDRIRQMSNEELASILCKVRPCCLYCIGKYSTDVFCNMSCKDGIKAYLDMEATND